MMPKQSGSRQNFLDQMNSWNPMKDDYNNSKFNQYSSGPGASLDPELQPSELAKLSRNHQNADTNNAGKKTAPVPYLVFKHLPKDMTTKALENICSSYGKVTSVRDSNKNDNYFVDCASIADMDAIYRKLEHNTYGFKVFIGKQVKEISQAVDEPTNLPLQEPKLKNAVDLSSRNYLTSSKQHPRPQIKQKPIVSCSDYNSRSNLLQQNDPQRHFLIEDDAHRLERAGLMKPNIELKTNSKYKYHNGNAYIEMNEDTKKSIVEKNKQSVGQYEASSESYKNVANAEIKEPKCGPCLQCQRTCDSVCARCSQYLCSVQCQRKSWSTHRYVCGKPEHMRKNQNKKQQVENQQLSSTQQLSEIEQKTRNHQMPENPSLNATIENISANMNPFTGLTSTASKALNPKIPQSGSLVTIITISKTNVVFIRSKSSEDNLLFFQIISAIQTDGKNLKPLRKLPKCGQIVVTKYKELYSRAMILDTSDLNKIKLIHMDHGVLDIKLFDELFDAPLYYCELPRLVIPVILKDVPDVYMTDEIRMFMYSYLNGIDLQLKYDSNDLNEDRGAYVVELVDLATNQNFNKIILNLAKPEEPVSNNDIIHRNFLKHQLLPKGENVQLVVMDNSLLCTGCISCTTVEYALEIQKFQSELQTYANSLPQQDYAPRVDELCVAKYSVDQKWYRGRCLELVGDGHPTIVFFDYGNIATVNIKDIRRYPRQFSCPIFTSDCEIKGLPEHCDEKLVAKLEELIPHGSVIKCDSIEVYEEDFFHVITMKSIIRELILAGFTFDLQK